MFMTEVRVDSESGQEFLAEEVAVMHSPIRFVIDFKNTTPRIDLNNQQPRMVIKHSTILMDPFVAKKFMDVLKENIEKYEKSFGKIKEPEAMEKAKKLKKETEGKPDRQDYFG